MTFPLLALLLLPPAAAEHNRAAMAHYEAGRLEAAESEFAAASALLPDPRRDREDREAVLGSLRGLLLVMHRQTGSPAPLCRLRAVLRAHLDTLPATPPDTPEPPESTVNRERLAEVTGQLAAFPADACAPADPPPAADPPTPQPATPPSPRSAVTSPPPATRPSSPDGPTPRQLRIAGGVSLGLGGALLVAMTYGLVNGQRHLADGRAIDAEAADRPFTKDERTRLGDHLDEARFSRNLAIGAGISSGIFSLAGVALITTAKRKSTKTNSRQNGVLMAPMRLPSGLGLTLRWALP